MDRFDGLEKLKEYFNDAYILDSIVKAMSDSDALNIMGFIARMEDLDEPELIECERE